jgi:hypothetical protein
MGHYEKVGRKKNCIKGKFCVGISSEEVIKLPFLKIWPWS